MAKIIRNHSGMSLIEVLIAFAIFSFFILGFTMSLGFNKESSFTAKNDLMLHQLANRILREKKLDPPKFTNATENTKESKEFEEEHLADYKYTIEYKKMDFPDLDTLMPPTDPNQANNQEQMQKKILTKLKENIELMLWQMRVTVTNTQTEEFNEVSTWVINQEAQIDTNFSL